jgi:hypothetical protein
LKSVVDGGELRVDACYFVNTDWTVISRPSCA